MKVSASIGVLFGTIITAGCASTNDQPARSVTRFYGNFCGAGHPNVGDASRQALNALHELKPIDDIDGACKQHDICYTAYAEHAAICDRALLDSLEGMHFSGTNEQACNRIARAIRSAFIVLPLKAHPGNVLDSLVNSALGTVGVLVAPIAVIDIMGDVPTRPCKSIASITYDVPPSTEPALVPPMDQAQFLALSHEQRCERLGNVAFNATYSRIRGAALQDMRDLAKTDSGSGFSAETLSRIVEDVYRHPSLSGYAMATVHWLRCMRAELSGPLVSLRSTDEVLDKIENCQYIPQAKPFQVCVASALVGRH